MEQVRIRSRICAALDGFVVGLRLANPEAGCGNSEPFDSAFWVLLSLLEGRSSSAPTIDALTDRLPFVLESTGLSADTREGLERFVATGDPIGTIQTESSSPLSRVLGVALCEPDPKRRIRQVVDICVLTHCNPSTVQSSLAAVELLAWLLSGVDAETAADETLPAIDHAGIRAVLLTEDASVLSAAAVSGSPGIRVVAAMVWASRQSGSAMAVLEGLVEATGGDEVTASLAGAVLGAQGRSFAGYSCQELRASEIAAEVLYVRNSS